MLLEVNARDLDAWTGLSHAIAMQLRHDMTGEAGTTMRALMLSQVDLITSLPTEAAQRVHDMTMKGLSDSTRASEYAKEIERTGEVTRSRAILIARTETSRTATSLMQARAASAGSTHYIWRTSEDGDVRPGHQAMDGKVCDWANPPAVEENGKIMHFHPGCVWNCRCWPEPILPNV